MTLRDWFAGQALAGWLASYGDEAAHPAMETRNQKPWDAELARLSYCMADAMIAEKAKP
jgi:hypothetical protein